MPKVNCPHCGLPAVRAGLINAYKFYCARCGWNHEVVERELSSAIKVSSVLVALGVVFAVVVRFKNPSGSMAWAILLAFSGLPMYYALSALLQVRKLRNMSFQPAIDQSRAFGILEMSSSGVASKTIVFEEKEFPDLVALPRPRKLKTTWKGRFYFAFVLAVVSLCTIYGLPALWSEFKGPNFLFAKHWPLIVLPLFIYGNSLVFFRNRFRERKLLTNGELASGYVTAQHNGQYMQSIQYCFKLADGKLITGRCNDASRSLFEGMTVPVFYDADNPARSIPLHCSLTRLA